MNALNDPPLPERIETEEQLDELMTQPRGALVEFIKALSSPLLILGASGKMGPTLAGLARRAAAAAGHDLEITAVSRFSDPAARRWLEARGIRTILVFVPSPPSPSHCICCIGCEPNLSAPAQPGTRQLDEPSPRCWRRRSEFSYRPFCCNRLVFCCRQLDHGRRLRRRRSRCPRVATAGPTQPQGHRTDPRHGDQRTATTP